MSGKTPSPPSHGRLLRTPHVTAPVQRAQRLCLKSKRKKKNLSLINGHVLESSPRLTRVKGHAHDRGFPGTVGPQQSSDLASVEGEGQVADGRLVALVFLGHRHQGDAQGAPCWPPLPVL